MLHLHWWCITSPGFEIPNWSSQTLTTGKIYCAAVETKTTLRESPNLSSITHEAQSIYSLIRSAARSQQPRNYHQQQQSRLQQFSVPQHQTGADYVKAQNKTIHL